MTEFALQGCGYPMDVIILLANRSCGIPGRIGRSLDKAVDHSQTLLLVLCYNEKCFNIKNHMFTLGKTDLNLKKEGLRLKREP